MNDTIDLSLCDHCGAVKAIHMGYDHGKNGGCILAADWIDLSLRFGERAKDVVRMVNKLTAEADAAANVGEGI